jgi:hypothetical protein
VDAGSDQLGLPRDAEPPVRGPGRDQRGAPAVAVARGRRGEDLIAVTVELLHAECGEQLDAVSLRLSLHGFGELRPTDAVREPRMVVDPLGHARLPAQRAPLDHEGVSIPSRAA